MEKNSKGFTLIELLAVILILGIIALIAIPTVNDIIEESRFGAAKRSAEGYIKAVENGSAVSIINSSNSIPANGVFTVSDLEGKADYKGDGPTDGWVHIEDMMVTECSLKISKYIINCDIANNDFKKGDELAEEPSGDESAILCTASTTLKKDGVGYLKTEAGAYASGVEYTCELGDGVNRTFYVVEDGGSENATSDTPDGMVSLIMDTNIVDEVIFMELDGYDTVFIPEFYPTLYEATSDWTKLKDSNKDVISIEQIVNILNLPSASEIDYYTLVPAWLSADVSDEDWERYWTKSYYGDGSSGDEYAYNILDDSYAGRTLIDDNYRLDYPASLRPVITISKNGIR